MSITASKSAILSRITRSLDVASSASYGISGSSTNAESFPVEGGIVKLTLSVAASSTRALIKGNAQRAARISPESLPRRGRDLEYAGEDAAPEAAVVDVIVVIPEDNAIFFFFLFFFSMSQLFEFFLILDFGGRPRPRLLAQISSFVASLKSVEELDAIGNSVLDDTVARSVGGSRSIGGVSR